VDNEQFAHLGQRLEILSQRLEIIAQNTASQVVELSSVAYLVGVAVSLGLNLAAHNGLGAFFLCWLSWINVGYIMHTPS